MREQACSALGVIAGLLGRQLAPQLKALMPPWLCCKCDAQHDVRRAATAAFAAAFPTPDKFGGALNFCREELVRSLAERALTPAPPKPSDKEEAAEVQEQHERAVASALQALAALILGVPDAGREPLSLLLETPLPQLWRLAAHKAAPVRASLYALCLALLQGLPTLAAQELGGLGTTLLDGLSEKEPMCHAALWEPLLLLLRSHADGLRGATPAHRHILSRLTSLLRHGCYGGALSVSHALLPLAALLPDEQLTPPSDQSLAAAAALLPAIWEGLSSDQLAAAHLPALLGA